MFIKLIVLVLALGSTAVGVLALRQSRLQAAHEAAEARLRIRTHTETTLELRTQIGRAIAPDAIAKAAAELDMLHTIDAQPDSVSELLTDPETGEPIRADRESLRFDIDEEHQP